MKKLVFVAAVVLAAALMAGCDGFMPPEADDEGVTIFIGGEGARSILPDEADAYSVYFEVIFLRDGDAPEKCRRLAWSGLSNPKIKLPVTSTPTKFDAVVFAGTTGGKNLLAVGTLVDDMIDTGTKSVTFGLVRFKAELTGRTPTDEDAFAITNGGSGPRTTIQSDGIDVPLWPVARNDSDITATYALDLVKTDGSSVVWGDYAQYIIVEELSTVNSIGVSLDMGQKPAALLASGFDDSILVAGAPLPQVLGLNFETPDKDGLAQIALEIQVSPLFDRETTGSYVTWTIKPGIANYEIDDGSNDAEPESGGLNGGILLGVGDYERGRNDGIDIIIKFQD
jgi:hypothetical protein